MSAGKKKETVVVVIDWDKKKTMTNWFDDPDTAWEFALDVVKGTKNSSSVVERPEGQG